MLVKKITQQKVFHKNGKSHWERQSDKEKESKMNANEILKQYHKLRVSFNRTEQDA